MARSRPRRAVIIGAGAGGLAAAIDLARAGLEVTVLERAAAPGGKMRQVLGVDAGPTVFTMRWVFEALFADAGADVSAHLNLTPAHILARHAWRAGGRLDLFADIDESADAIADFAGAKEAMGYRAFCARSRDIYQTLVGSFMCAERPSALELAQRVGWRRLDALWRTVPFTRMWAALGDHFHDPRLRQLFGRYATYCGSSPFAAPATLMLIAHVEQDGVWLVEGGMTRVAAALRDLAERQGAIFRFNAHVAEIRVQNDRVAGVTLDDGEVLEADIVVSNADPSAIGSGCFGDGAAGAVRAAALETRSLSAVTWCMNARPAGFPLAHHNVFFAEDYRAEFDAIFREHRIVDAPTVYLCAQDRVGGDVAGGVRGDTAAGERMLVLINAPAVGDQVAYSAEEIGRCHDDAFALLRACGLELHPTGDVAVTTPSQFHQLFPATGGALYGRANHGPTASFARPTAATDIPGLYLAGGATHPGPGVPMSAMSGRLAAARVLSDIGSQ